MDIKSGWPNKQYFLFDIIPISKGSKITMKRVRLDLPAFYTQIPGFTSAKMSPTFLKLFKFAILNKFRIPIKH